MKNQNAVIKLPVKTKLEKLRELELRGLREEFEEEGYFLIYRFKDTDKYICWNCLDFNMKGKVESVESTNIYDLDGFKHLEHIVCSLCGDIIGTIERSVNVILMPGIM